LFAVVDCTGHGVPGAFMSMIGNDLLNNITGIKRITDPAQILEELNIGIRTHLQQGIDDNSVQDGMDVALISIEDYEGRKTINFAGARRPLHYLRQGIGDRVLGVEDRKLLEIKGDKLSIGGKQKEDIRKFTSHSIDLEADEEAVLYLSSDGIIDQNNNNSEKFGTKRLKELLENIAVFDMQTQKNEIENSFNQFLGNEHLRDDVTLVGIRVN
jgi:serine phosphatase RsbU (regulator of sigma subunit)